MLRLGVLLALLGAANTPRLVAQQAYTNADVIKMVQAHLGVSVIVEQIRSNPGHYLLTPDSLVRLAHAGVPDEVIAAMQEKKSTQTAPEPQRGEDATTRSSPHSAPEQKSPESSSKWEVVDSVDSLTGRAGSYLKIAHISGTPGGRFEVHASCDADIRFTVSFYSLNRGKVFSRSIVPTDYKGIGQGQPGSQCVHMSVAVGSAEPIGYYSPFCDSDENDASVAFFGPGLFRKGGEMTQDLFTSTAPNSALAAAASTWLKAMTSVAARIDSPLMEKIGSGLQMQHVIDGDPLAVRLPFKDGSASTVRLNLRDPVVSHYVAACMAEAHRQEVEELVRQGNAYDAQGAYTKAEQTYAAALKLDPENRAAKDGLAKTEADYADLRRRYNAEQASNAAKSGQEACAKGDYGAAIKSYSHALELDGTNQSAQRALTIARQRQAETEKQEAEDAPLGWWREPVQPLMWTIKDNGADLRWKQAEKYCSELRLGGFADWRLATQQELGAIFDPLSNRTTAPTHHDGSVYHAGRRIESWPKGSVWTYHIRGNIEPQRT